MDPIMSVISWILSLSVFIAPVGAAQAAVASSFSNYSTLQRVSPLSSTPTTASSPRFFSQQTTSNASNSESNGPSTAGLLGAGLATGGLVLGGAYLAQSLTGTAAATVPTTITSLVGAAGSFGGRITAIIPCVSYAGPSELVTILPAPATKNISYIWTPLTLRGMPPPGLPPTYPPSPNPDPMPYAVGQQILGIADIPFFCCVPPSVPAAGNICAIPAYPFWIPVPGLIGQRMEWANQSLAPGVPGTEALTGTGAIY